MRPRLLPFLCILCLHFQAVFAEPFNLSITLRDSVPEISSTFFPLSIIQVERSSDLHAWREFGMFEQHLAPYRDSQPGPGPVYYRARALINSPLAYANQYNTSFSSSLRFGYDRFQPGFVKFVIDLADPEKVYFHRDLLHHNFVRAYLPAYRDITAQDFEEISLFTTNQKLLLGTLFFQPLGYMGGEYGIQFVGRDPYPADYISRFFQIVRNRIIQTTRRNAFYFPDIEQIRYVEANAQSFTDKGLNVSSLGRWTIQDASYSVGWAVGLLKYFTIDQVPAAWASGQLREEDILLTDYIPADLPAFAGILALNPSSPGSHVALFAQADNRPFAYLASADLREHAHSLVGRNVLLTAADTSRATTQYPGAPWTDYIKLVDVSTDFDTLTNLIHVAATSAPFNYPPKDHSPVLSLETSRLFPADAKRFGGKAANYGLLRRAIPTNSPPAIAFSFNLWDAFMAQELSPSRTLRQEINERLSLLSLQTSPTVFAAKLQDIRDLIRNTPFPPAMEQPVIAALASFDSGKNIRFRSSSNVEDAETFTAAGLYDSYSGCLADDLDGDNSGPSLCDPTENGERGVFRAIKRVFASFYNEQAFRERRKRAVDENQVGMALLAHHSFPDEIEYANGVVVLTFTSYSPDLSIYSYLQTTQKGALSVANPESGASPEILQGYHYSGFTIKQYSSLLPFGAIVMSGNDIDNLQYLLNKTAYAYSALFPEKQKFVLDYEFKVTPDGVILKQIRPVPQAAPNSTIIGVGEDLTFATLQSWPDEIFDNYYLKSQWRFKMPPMLISSNTPGSPLFTEVNVNLQENGVIRTYQGPLHTLPDYTQFLTNNIIYNQWRFESAGPLYTLACAPRPAATAENHLQTLSAWHITLSVLYPEPRLALACTRSNGPEFVCTNSVIYTNSFTSTLLPLFVTNANSLAVWRNWTATNGVNIRSDYYWVRFPEGSFGGSGYTSPLVGWKGTEITGLISTPIYLRGFYSQTYTSRRKNVTEQFIFDPWLEPGLSPEILQELQSANIRKIFVRPDQIGIIDSVDTIRFFPAQGTGQPTGWF